MQQEYILIIIATAVFAFLLGLACGRTSQKKNTAKIVKKIISKISEVKMVLLVRDDIKMGKGKIAAQVGHAAVGAYQEAKEGENEDWQKLVERWEWDGTRKICLKIKSEQEMLDLEEKARQSGLCTYIVMDAGLTQIDPQTKTVLAIGPGRVEQIDKLTRHLKLM